MLSALWYIQPIVHNTNLGVPRGNGELFTNSVAAHPATADIATVPLQLNLAFLASGGRSSSSFSCNPSSLQRFSK